MLAGGIGGGVHGLTGTSGSPFIGNFLRVLDALAVTVRFREIKGTLLSLNLLNPKACLRGMLRSVIVLAQ